MAVRPLRDALWRRIYAALTVHAVVCVVGFTMCCFSLTVPSSATATATATAAAAASAGGRGVRPR